MIAEELDSIKEIDIIYHKDNRCCHCLSKNTFFYLYTRTAAMFKSIHSNKYWIVLFCEKHHLNYSKDAYEKQYIYQKLTEQDVFYLRITGKL